MLAGVDVQFRPDGEDEEVSVIVPVKPFTGDTVTVELALVPALTLTAVGLEDMEKSVTTTSTLAE